MDNLAKLCGVQINVTRSFTKLVNPTDMPINNMTMFFIGRGIEFTVLDKKGKNTICDKKCLGSNFEYSNSFNSIYLSNLIFCVFVRKSNCCKRSSLLH